MHSAAMSAGNPLKLRGRTGWARRASWGGVVVLGLWVGAVVAAPRPDAPPPPGAAQPGSVPNAIPTPNTPRPLPSFPSSPPVAVPLAHPMGGVPTFPLPPLAPGPEPAAFLQPEPQPKGPAGEPLAQPRPLPFGEERARLSRLGVGQLGATPVPTPQDLAEFARWIDRVVDPRNTLDLIQGRARVIMLKATPFRTLIADPSIATFRLLEPDGTQMVIIGARPGITVLNLWFTDPMNKDKETILSYLVRVLPDPEAKERMEAIYKALELEINKAFPNSRVRLKLIGDKLMVSGQAYDAYDATQILRIARSNAPTQLPITSVAPTAGQLGPTGAPLDPLRPTATPGIEAFELAGGPNVINDLRVPGEQQVMLRVTVAEVNRNAARSIGVNFSITNNAGLTVFTQNTGGIAGSANLPIILDAGQIPVALQALRTLNYARSLAEPNLTAMNGQSATFLAGGQFPVPVIGSFGVGGVQGVQFVPFGVQLQFSPVVLDRDRVRLTIQATVSTLDAATATNIGGSNVSGLNSRQFSTTVELREGQTMAVAGLLQNSLGADSSRVPLLGDIPFFGQFWSVSRVSNGEQELVVLVTPELVHPLEPKEISPLPGSDAYEPGDLEFYLLGRIESLRSYDYRSPIMTTIHRMLRYRRCEQIYIIGPSGHVDPPEPGLGPNAGK